MLISVVTVVHNESDLIRQTLESVLRQSFENHEYIVVDCHSSDASAHIISEYEDRLTHFLQLPSDTGRIAAMNAAIVHCRGEFVIFLNAGTVFDTDDTLVQVSSELGSAVDILYGQRELRAGNSARIMSPAPLEQSLKQEIVDQQCQFIRTALLRARALQAHYQAAAFYENFLFALHQDYTCREIDVVITVSPYLSSSTDTKLAYRLEAAHVALHYFSLLRNSSVLTGQLPSRFEHEELNELVLSQFQHMLRRDLRRDARGNPGFKITTSGRSKRPRLHGEQLGRRSRRWLDGINQALKNASKTMRRQRRSASAWQRLKSRLNLPGRVEPGIELPPDRLQPVESTAPVSNYSKAPITLPTKPHTVRVSVVTICYNAGSELEMTIDSVLEQRYSNIEYVIVDGASNDGTGEVLARHASRIDKMISEPDDGIYDAMNKGLTLATGDYVIFMNAGDTFSDADAVLDVFGYQRDLTDLIYGARYYSKPGRPMVYQPARAFETVVYQQPYCHQSVFIKREVLLNHPFNTTYRYAADYDQAYRLFKAGCTYLQLEQPISIFAAGGSSETGLRPHLETVKILLDNCKDPAQIQQNVYYQSLSRSFDRLIKV